MQIISVLISLLLPWAAVDLSLLRRRKSLFSDETTISFSQEEELWQRKRAQRLRSNVIPIELRRARPRVRSKCSYLSIKSKDVRDSNQRKIRRRFNNM